MASYFLTRRSRKSNEMGQNLIGTIFLSVSIATTLMRWTFWSKQKQAVFLWNSFLTSVEKHLPRKSIFIYCIICYYYLTTICGCNEFSTRSKKLYDTTAKTLLSLGIVTSGDLAALVLAMLLADPCQPPHLRHMFLKAGIGHCFVPSHMFGFVFVSLDQVSELKVFLVCLITFVQLQPIIVFLDVQLNSLTTRRDQEIIRRWPMWKYSFFWEGNMTQFFKLCFFLCPSIFAIGIFAIIIAMFIASSYIRKYPCQDLNFSH